MCITWVSRGRHPLVSAPVDVDPGLCPSFVWFVPVTWNYHEGSIYVTMSEPGSTSAGFCVCVYTYLSHEHVHVRVYTHTCAGFQCTSSTPTGFHEVFRAVYIRTCKKIPYDTCYMMGRCVRIYVYKCIHVCVYVYVYISKNLCLHMFIHIGAAKLKRAECSCTCINLCAYI